MIDEQELEKTLEKLIATIEGLTELQRYSDEIDEKLTKMSSVQQKMIESLDRRVEILELRLDIEEPKTGVDIPPAKA